METVCQVCGKTVYLKDLPKMIAGGPLDDHLRKSMLNIARMAVHDWDHEDGSPSCMDVLRAERRRRRETETLARQMASLPGVYPPEFQETRLDHPMMMTAAALEALAWTYGPKGLLLIGPSGQAKTRCAFELLKREHLAGRACCHFTPGEWIVSVLRLRSNFKEGKAWLDMVKSCDLLLCDDLGKERMTFANHEATEATTLLFDLVETRGRNQVPTIVTTQLRAEGFERCWGEHGIAFARRLATYCKPVKFEYRKEP